MRRKWIVPWMLVLVAIAGVAVWSEGAAEPGVGALGLLPFTDAEQGLMGVVPGDWAPIGNGVHGPRQALESGDLDAFRFVMQVAYPDVTPAQLLDLVEQDPTTRFDPEPFGTYEGATFSWHIYTLEQEDADIGVLRSYVMLAEQEATIYAVSVGTLATNWERDQEFILTLLRHAAYAMKPLE
jgi:hypothetical protein